MRKRFLVGFHYDAHPMGMLVSAVAALSTFYLDAKAIHDDDSRQKQIVVTHGTDTMVETARALAAAGLRDKTIVLTGAMVPYAFGSSDGLFNLGSALSFVQVLPPDVYVAMNGQHFRWDGVRKNTASGVFEPVA